MLKNEHSIVLVSQSLFANTLYRLANIDCSVTSTWHHWKIYSRDVFHQSVLDEKWELFLAQPLLADYSIPTINIPHPLHIQSGDNREVSKMRNHMWIITEFSSPRRHLLLRALLCYSHCHSHLPDRSHSSLLSALSLYEKVCEMWRGLLTGWAMTWHRFLLSQIDCFQFGHRRGISNLILFVFPLINGFVIKLRVGSLHNVYCSPSQDVVYMRILSSSLSLFATM